MSSYPPLSDEYFMNQALIEAHKAFAADEVPVGAVLVCQQKILGRAHNLSECLNDATAHAEMQAYTIGSSVLGGKYLGDCTLYVTLEPCVMCAGAAYWTQLGRLVYGASDEKRGFMRYGAPLLHPKTELKRGVLEEDCRILVQEFFKKKR